MVQSTQYLFILICDDGQDLHKLVGKVRQGVCQQSPVLDSPECTVHYDMVNFSTQYTIPIHPVCDSHDWNQFLELTPVIQPSEPCLPLCLLDPVMYSTVTVHVKQYCTVYCIDLDYSTSALQSAVQYSLVPSSQYTVQYRVLYSVQYITQYHQIIQLNTNSTLHTWHTLCPDYQKSRKLCRSKHKMFGHHHCTVLFCKFNGIPD